MIRFNNDYNHGAFPEILKALEDTNGEAYAGYGEDEWCERAKAAIQKYLRRPDAGIHFLIGGTQTNFVCIAAALRPYESVIAADSGHVSVHESGAVENTGHKVETLPGENGKIRASQIEALAESYETSPVQDHITRPRLVYISFPTEYGTLYSKAELEAIKDVCVRHGLYLFIDGARLGYGLNSPENDVSLEDLGRLADAFYIGGTKCGALMGEAVVLNHPVFKEHFRTLIKQNGAMLAKGWLLGLQFAVMFEDGLYFSKNGKAVEYALEIKKAFAAKGMPVFIDSPTNQQFIIIPDEAAAKLAEKYYYEPWTPSENGSSVIRFCTSWATSREEVDSLLADIAAL